MRVFPAFTRGLITQAEAVGWGFEIRTQVSQTETIEFETEFGEIDALFNCPLKITAGNAVFLPSLSFLGLRYFQNGSSAITL